MVIHVVTPGETPATIAARYGVPLDRLLADNGLTPDQSLVVGQALVILFANQTYTVQPGDTLSSIAAQFDTDTNQLFRNNPQLMGNATLTAGDVLVINWLTEKQGLVTINGYAYPFIQHNPKVVFNEDCFPVGAAGLAACAEGWLANHAK